MKVIKASPNMNAIKDKSYYVMVRGMSNCESNPSKSNYEFKVIQAV